MVTMHTHTHTCPYFDYHCQAGLKNLHLTRHAPQNSHTRAFLVQEWFYPILVLILKPLTLLFLSADCQS